MSKSKILIIAVVCSWFCTGFLGFFGSHGKFLEKLFYVYCEQTNISMGDYNNCINNVGNVYITDDTKQLEKISSSLYAAYASMKQATCDCLDGRNILKVGENKLLSKLVEIGDIFGVHKDTQEYYKAACSNHKKYLHRFIEEGEKYGLKKDFCINTLKKFNLYKLY